MPVTGVWGRYWLSGRIAPSWGPGSSGLKTTVIVQLGIVAVSSLGQVVDRPSSPTAKGLPMPELRRGRNWDSLAFVMANVTGALVLPISTRPKSALGGLMVPLGGLMVA